MNKHSNLNQDVGKEGLNADPLLSQLLLLSESLQKPDEAPKGLFFATIFQYLHMIRIPEVSSSNIESQSIIFVSCSPSLFLHPVYTIVSSWCKVTAILPSCQCLRVGSRRLQLCISLS